MIEKRSAKSKGNELTMTGVKNSFSMEHSDKIRDMIYIAKQPVH